MKVLFSSHEISSTFYRTVLIITAAYVKAHKSFDRSDLFRNNEIIFFSCILLSLRYIEKTRIIPPVPGSPILSKTSFLRLHVLKRSRISAFLANQHFSLGSLSTNGNFPFSQRTEKNRFGRSFGQAVLSPSRVSLPRAPRFFFSRHIDFSRACHAGYSEKEEVEMLISLIRIQLMRKQYLLNDKANIFV